MLFPQVFLSLVAGASAIDIWLNWSNGCNGKKSVLCPNLNPNTCCSNTGVTGSPFDGVAITEIPESWRIEGRGHEGTGCGKVIQLRRSNGAKSMCLSDGPFGGGGYGFVNSKRSVDTEIDCAETVRPSIVVFGDGVRYNLTGLDDASYHEMSVNTFAIERSDLGFV